MTTPDNITVVNSLELNGTIAEAVIAYNEVEQWAKTEKTKFSLNFWAMGPAIRKEPKGIVLIIGPYNVPVWALIVPLVSYSVPILISLIFYHEMHRLAPSLPVMLQF